MKARRTEPEQSRLTKAIPHIALSAANRGKLAALDALWEAYRELCQTYATHFCMLAPPDKFAAFIYASPLSARWQRVAVQQAAGIAQSWRTKRRQATDAYLARFARYAVLPPAQQAKHKRPVWQEWNVPELHAVCIQANANVVKTLADSDETLALSPAEQGQFDLWLHVATLTPRQPVLLPVKLADYHKLALAGQQANTSVTLNRRKGRWWLTLSISQDVPEPTSPTGEVRGVDVGISNFLTSSTGQHYGSFKGNLAERHTRDRAKRQRKAKLRACLERKGVTKLPSTSSATGQRLSRHVRQSINYAVNQFLEECAGCCIALESLSVSTMRFKAKRANAYLYAANLAHVPEQIVWGALKRGLPVVSVNPAYSSQCCPRCHYTSRDNRPSQQTFCCRVCGYVAHADVVGATNIARRVDDRELVACQTVEAVKHLLDARHARWKQQGCP